MFTERLHAVMREAERLSPQMQDQLAEQLHAAIAEAKWRALLSNPRSDAFFDEMIAEIEREEPCPLR